MKTSFVVLGEEEFETKKMAVRARSHLVCEFDRTAYGALHRVRVPYVPVIPVGRAVLSGQLSWILKRL